VWVGFMKPLKADISIKHLFSTKSGLGFSWLNSLDKFCSSFCHSTPVKEVPHNATVHSFPQTEVTCLEDLSVKLLWVL